MTTRPTREAVAAATQAFLVYAESKIKPGEPMRAAKLMETAVRWCAKKHGCPPTRARGFAAALRARGWTSHRDGRGVRWTFGQSGSAT